MAWFRGEQAGRVGRDDPSALTIGCGAVAQLRGRDDRSSISRDMESSLILIVIATSPPTREPGTGANARRLPRTDRDTFRVSLQVRGFSADSLRPGQTDRS